VVYGDDSADDVLLLRLTPYGDHDLIVTMLGARLGMVRAFAKSARSSRKRFPGLQPMLMAHVHTASRRGDLLDLRSAEIDVRLADLALDVRRYALAAYLIEVTQRCVPEGEVAATAYPLLRDALLAMCVARDPISCVRAFELRFLRDSGELPDPLVLDVGTDGSPWWHAIAPQLFASALDRGRALLVEPVGSVAMNGEEQRAIGRIFASWLHAHHPGKLASVAFLHQL
jgi:Recombination protein O N terminal/Recombination protein O C terminal